MASSSAASSASLGRGGGYRQRAARAAQLHQAEHPPRQSKLARKLLDRWSWGLLSAPMVQELASCAVEDGAQGEDLLVLSKLGSQGRYPNKCHKELMDKLRPTSITDVLGKISVFYMYGKMVKQINQEILLPHELFAQLYAKHKDQFMVSMCGGSQGNIEQYWEAMKDHPALPGHPLLLRRDYKKFAIPVAIHGDAVEVSGVGKAWSKSLEVYSWSSMLGKGPYFTHQLLDL
eukprot:1357461-Alexandrium_andersonii.AAC.1